METIQLRISKKVFCCSKNLPFLLPGLFRLTNFLVFFGPSVGFSTPQKQQTKNARTSKRHAKICCAQNFYGDYYYYYY
jgi:hypothetical protein